MSEREKIDLLIIRYLDGNIDTGDTSALRRWMDKDSCNLQYFTEMKKIWDSCNALGSSPEELEIALNRFRKNFKAGMPVNPYRTVWFSPWIYRIAAVIILGILVFGVNRYLDRNDGSVPKGSMQQQTNNKIIIPKGQKGQLILSDGTKVWLNSESTLEYPGTFGNQREVILSGEAYFEVKSDQVHPFFVQTPKLKIKVTGTIFNIKAYEEDDKIETTLVTGRLSIINNDRELVVLQPNESAVYSRAENSLHITDLAQKVQQRTKTQLKSDKKTEEISLIELVAVWKDDKLIFQDEPLGLMVPKLERWFNCKIHVSNPELLTNEYNGKFVYNETIYQVLDVICRSSADLNYKEVDHEFYISKK